MALAVVLKTLRFDCFFLNCTTCTLTPRYDWLCAQHEDQRQGVTLAVIEHVLFGTRKIHIDKLTVGTLYLLRTRLPELEMFPKRNLDMLLILLQILIINNVIM